MTDRRKQLQKIGNKSVGLSGVFVRFGGYQTRRGKLVKTILIEHIHDLQGNYLCDHSWMPYKWCESTHGLVAGDMVKFRARVKRYADGRRFGLRSIHKLKRI